VHELFALWGEGLIERQLRSATVPHVLSVRAYPRCDPAELAARIAALPAGLTRISVGRFAGDYMGGVYGNENAFEEYANIRELGGFVVSGPFELSEITRRYGAGDFRITAFGLEPPGLRWEILVSRLTAPT
jgi:hypothetical protein